MTEKLKSRGGGGPALNCSLVLLVFSISPAMYRYNDNIFLCFFFWTQTFFFAVKTKCVRPNITLFTYNKRRDNLFCRRECGKLPGGRLAVPQNRAQYDCMTTAIGETAQHQTPLWTGIRVRPNGGMYDPRSNKTVRVFVTNNADLPSNLSPYQSLLVKASANKSENCIYFHDSFFVEAKCTFLHPGDTPIGCACIQGKRLPTTGTDPRLKGKNLILKPEA